MLQQVMQIAKGNPGAANAAIELIKITDEVFKKLLANDIVGTELYVLYSDICGRNNTMFLTMLEQISIDVLKDASSRQDYSGREIPEIRNFVNSWEL